MPKDFPEKIRTMTSHMAAKHYKTTLTLITAWRKECKCPKRAMIARPYPLKRRRGRTKECLSDYQRDMSKTGMAVDFLRKFGPVFSCDEKGRPDHRGKFWNRGGWVLSDDDVVSRAVRLGWVMVEV